MIKLILHGCLLTMLLVGCATNYNCGQFPESGCQPVSEVYERTNNGFHDYRRTLYDDEIEKDGYANRPIELNQTQHAAVSGDPILTRPVVMRVLFNSWKDKNGDLNAGGFVYVRVRDSQWLIEN